MDWNKTILLIGSLIFTLVLMSIGSNGSFNPKEIGFYSSLAAGILHYFLLRWWLFRPMGQKDQGKQQ
ncbi:hypothetical protein ADIS_4253 [Lunatimonas lonarensis]|uniref:Uncharacterized protein n=1 Tax=Lunatimonas lonarensis TaxID=1232681 RepID=R7ZLX9_9BACT|nr:hypothetical protein ADIS_4253 [Lunatimonas lonarensis]